jgi:hypothetical protein
MTACLALFEQVKFPAHTTGMLTTTAFAAKLLVCGLDFIFTLKKGVACQVSTPSHYWAWLGISILKPSPNLSDFQLTVTN